MERIIMERFEVTAAIGLSSAENLLIRLNHTDKRANKLQIEKVDTGRSDAVKNESSVITLDKGKTEELIKLLQTALLELDDSEPESLSVVEAWKALLGGKMILANQKDKTRNEPVIYKIIEDSLHRHFKTYDGGMWSKAAGDCLNPNLRNIYILTDEEFNKEFKS